MVVIYLERKWSTNCILLDAKGSLLVLVYVYIILPDFHPRLILSLVMPCTLVHLFVLLNNAYKMWLGLAP